MSTCNVLIMTNPVNKENNIYKFYLLINVVFQQQVGYIQQKNLLFSTKQSCNFVNNFEHLAAREIFLKSQ